MEAQRDDGKIENGFLEPERIVQAFGLKKGEHVGDFGVGHGYFTVPMARAVGGDGRVYAIDIQKAALDIVRARAQLEHLLNIEYVWADLDTLRGSGLKDKFLDFVLISNILFQVGNRLVLVQEAYRVLRPGGLLAVIEWDAALRRSIDYPDDPGGMDSIRSSGGDMGAALGPPAEVRIKKEDARALAAQSGFEFDREFAAGSHHYGLVFTKR